MRMQALGGSYSLCLALGRPNHGTVYSFGFPETSETLPNQSEPGGTMVMVGGVQGM